MTDFQLNYGGAKINDLLALVDSGEATTGSYVSPFVDYGANNLSGGTFDIYKWGNIVTITGVASTISAITLNTSGVQMGTIPSGYRPRANIHSIQQGSGSNRWYMYVNPQGEVYAERYSNGASYNTTSAQTASSAGTWLPFSLTYVI